VHSSVWPAGPAAHGHSGWLQGGPSAAKRVCCQHSCGARTAAAAASATAALACGGELRRWTTGAMVMSGARQSLTGTHDGVDGTVVLAPRGSELAGSGDLHARRQGREVVGTENDHSGGARLTRRRTAVVQAPHIGATAHRRQ
jgi:hypothetical protein